jgi:hypothetical protein
MSLGYSSKNKIAHFEQILENTLVPIMPRAEFISNLRQQLENKISENERFSDNINKHTTFLAIASVVGSWIMLITSLRALLSLIGVISVISMIKRKPGKNSFSQSQTVVG